jgi:hypothetical protein
MPTPAFIAAASAANRQPVALLAIESVDAIKRAITTKDEWLAGTLVNLNALTEPGKLYMTTDGIEPYSGTYTGPVTAVGVLSSDSVITGYGPLNIYNGYYADYADLSGETASVNIGPLSTGVKLHFHTRVSAPLTFPIAGRGWIGIVHLTIQGRKDAGAWQDLQTLQVNGTNYSYESAAQHYRDTDITLSGLARGTWEFKVLMTRWVPLFIKVDGLSFDTPAINMVSFEQAYETHYLPTGSVSTSSVDLGTIPTQASRFESDDICPPGCSIAYNIWGGNDGASWTALGSIADGGSVAAYRYYRFSADLVSSGMATPVIDELRIVGGNSQYDYFSTRKDEPIQGARPYIAPGGISSISSKISLTSPATVGELTIKLFWTREVGDMIATGYLKNKTISSKIGFPGLSEQEFEPFFTGTWYDYQADSEKQIITVKTRNILKKFNRKVPSANYFLDVNGQAYVPPRLFTITGNIMQAMLQLADELGIPDRYLDRAAFNSLASGARTGTNWDIRRDIFEPQDASDLMNELAVSAGVFLVEGADGRLTVQLYDDITIAEPVATLDAKYHKFRQIDGGQKELFTRQTIYYQLLPGKDGGAASDYAKGLVYINQQAEIDWEESGTMEWMDKWGLSVYAIQKLAQRRDGWFANPLSSVKVENLPPRFWDIKAGQVVAVNNLQLPCPAAQWQGYTTGTRFLVMSKTTSDPTTDNLSISLDLMQIGDPAFVIDPDFPSYTPFEFFPAITNLELSERLIILPGGSVDTVLDVAYTCPTDFHYGAASIWAQVGGGAWELKGRQEYGGPSSARLFSFSVPDLQTVKVAILTINAAGQIMPLEQAPNASHFVIGKTAPPEDITDIAAIANISGAITLEWSPVSDIDLKEYVVCYSPLTTGAVWANSSEIQRTGRIPRATIPAALTGTYLVKALDTSTPGNFSLNAASVVVATVPTYITSTLHSLIDEAPAWDGTATNMTVVGDLLKLNPTIGNLSGSYLAASEVDLGTVQTVRVSGQAVWTLGSMSDAWDDISELDGMLGIDAAAYGGNVTMNIYTSQDASAPTFKQPLFAGDYVFRRARFELVAVCNNTDTLIQLSDFTVTVNSYA